MCQLPWAEVLRRVCFSSSPGLMVQIGLFSWMYSEMEMVMSLLIFGQQSQAMYFFVCLWVYSVYEKECMRRATRHDALDLITMFRWWFCSLKLCSMMHQGRALDQGLCLRGQEYTTCLCWEGVGSSVSCQRRSSSFLAEKCVPSARPILCVCRSLKRHCRRVRIDMRFMWPTHQTFLSYTLVILWACLKIGYTLCSILHIHAYTPNDSQLMGIYWGWTNRFGCPLLNKPTSSLSAIDRIDTLQAQPPRMRLMESQSTMWREAQSHHKCAM